MDSFLEKEEVSSIFIVDLPCSKYLENLGAIGFQMTFVYKNLLKLLPPFLSFISPIASMPLFISAMTILNFSTLSSIFKGKSKNFDLISSYLGLALVYHPYGIRGAVISEKIDEFIVPLIHKEKKEKPTIFIDYGAIHGDIEIYLKHKALRESVIKLHDLWNYFPFNREYLDKVCEFSFETQKQSEIERRITYEQIIHTLGSDKKKIVGRGSITKIKL